MQTSQHVSECPTFSDEKGTELAQLDTLSERQRAAMELILSGQSDVAVAKAIDVDRRTLYRWRHEHGAFADELHRRRRELWDGVVDRLRALLEPSVQILGEHLADSLDRNRYRAAVSILRLSNVRGAIPVREDDKVSG